MAARCAQPCPQEEPPPAPRRLTALAASAAQRKEKVAIIGSGNWGSAIAKVVGRNLLELGDFEDEVRMWVYQEQVDGKNLTDIINEKRAENKLEPVAPVIINYIGPDGEERVSSTALREAEKSAQEADASGDEK